MLKNEIVTFKVFPYYPATASTCYSISGNGAYYRIFVLHKILSILIFFSYWPCFCYETLKYRLFLKFCSRVWCSTISSYSRAESFSYTNYEERNASYTALCRDCGPDCVNQYLSALDSGFQDSHQSQKSCSQPKALSG